MMHFISLGAGVQSTALALMAAAGEITPMPDAAIFSDTRAEPKAVYDHLAWLQSGVLPFPIYVVKEKDGLTYHLEEKGRFAGAPFFAKTPKGEGMLRRQCTREFKVQPIIRKVRELVGLAPGRPGPRAPIVTQWIGFSTDEVVRATPSKIRWIQSRWPLLHKRMSRQDCLAWIAAHGFPRPPRSACVFCPYKSNEEWRQLRDRHPEDWAEAVRVDRIIRDGVRGVRDPLYVHRSLVPLDQVDLSTPEDRGQLNMFGNVCDGVCAT